MLIVFCRHFVYHIVTIRLIEIDIFNEKTGETSDFG